MPDASTSQFGTAPARGDTHGLCGSASINGCGNGFYAV
jgi:hypothetical protein